MRTRAKPRCPFGQMIFREGIFPALMKERPHGTQPWRKCRATQRGRKIPFAINAHGPELVSPDARITRFVSEYHAPPHQVHGVFASRAPSWPNEQAMDSPSTQEALAAMRPALVTATEGGRGAASAPRPGIPGQAAKTPSGSTDSADAWPARKRTSARPAGPVPAPARPAT